MRIGLLVCDHVSPRFLDVAGDYPDMFRRLFGDHPSIRLVDYDLPAGAMPASADECDGWITTGSRRSVYEDESWIAGLGDLVRSVVEVGRPYVGICFGHQMLAHALGGVVERAPVGWGVGVSEVKVPDPPAWLGVDSFRILNSYADQIESLPAAAEVLGFSDHCPTAVMTIGDDAVGFQGHPEFDPRYAAALMEHRRGGTIPADVADAGLASLASPPDNHRIADAIVRFLTSR